jgi:hypothetical protein
MISPLLSALTAVTLRAKACSLQSPIFIFFSWGSLLFFGYFPLDLLFNDSVYDFQRDLLEMCFRPEHVDGSFLDT